MADLFDSLFGEPEVPFIGAPEDRAYLDGDTVQDTVTGDRLRLQGINTPEVAHVTDTGFIKPGEVGGQLNTQLVSKLTRDNNFSQVKLKEKEDGTPERDAYGRYVGDLVNPETGERLSDKLLRSGLADVTLFSDKNQLNAALGGRLERARKEFMGEDLDEWDMASELINAKRRESDFYSPRPLAMTEQQASMAPEFFSNAPSAIRLPDRTSDNKARNSLKTAWALGTSGVFEGAWGSWDIIGDVLDWDNKGEDEVKRIQREISNLPELENLSAFDEKGNWRLDSAAKFVDYILTNAAASAPYMVASFASIAAAPYTFGASLAIPSVVYTGQTYNAQEDKNPATALISGVGQGVLDFFGVKGVQGATTSFLKDANVRRQVVEEIARNNPKFKGNIAAAESALANETIRQLVRFSDVAKTTLAAQFKNKYFDFTKNLGQATLKGTAAEAITETGQEVLASLGEKNFDVSQIDGSEFTNRLLNAAVAGGTLGGSLSGISQVKQNIGTGMALKDATTAADMTKTSKDAKYRDEARQEAGEQARKVAEKLVGDRRIAYDIDGNPEIVSVITESETGQLLVQREGQSDPILIGDELELVSVFDPEFIPGIKNTAELSVKDMDEATLNDIKDRAKEILIALRDANQLGNLSAKDAMRAINAINAEQNRRQGIPNAIPAQPELVTNSEISEQISKLTSINNIVNEAKAREDSVPEGRLKAIAKPEIDRVEGRSIFGAIEDFTRQGFGVLWKGLARQEGDKYIDRGPNIRKLFSMVGGNNIYHDSNIEDYQQEKEAALNMIVGSQDVALNRFQARSLKEINDIFFDAAVRKTIDAITVFRNKGDSRSFIEIYNEEESVPRLPAKYKDKTEVILEYAEKFDDHATRLSRELGGTKEDHHIFNQKAFNKQAIVRGAADFVNILVANGLSKKRAEQLVNDIIDLPYIEEVSDVYSELLTDAPLSPKDMDIAKLRSIPELKPFLNDDIFYKLSHSNGSAAAKLANKRFIGKDGAIIAYWIDKAVKAGEITEEEAPSVANVFVDYIAIRKGEYKRIENPTWRSFQNNALFLTTINQLPLATTSSIVELGLVTNNLSPDVIFNKGFIKDAAKAAAREIYDYFNEGVYKATRGRIKRADNLTVDPNRNGIFNLGYLQESQSVAQKNDINAGIDRQSSINTFFKIIGLQSLTNFTRSLRYALAGDAINGWLYDVYAEGNFPTKISQEARENLMDLGVDIDFLINVTFGGKQLSPMEEQRKVEMMRVATMRFVNQAVAHPSKSNRPKFYQNPRTALFFQFQGFISTFTSTILPKIYKNLLGSNVTYGTKLNTIGTMATLIFLGFLSQYLKDLIKYGEETPYLDNAGVFQRALNSSGLMGTGERVFNTLFPLYDTRTDGWLELALDEISSQAPALGYAGKLGDAAVEIASAGDKVPSRIQKAAPITGPINQLGWALDDLF